MAGCGGFIFLQKRPNQLVQRGAVVGESDSRGAYPRTEQFGPWDVMATMFSALGIDPHQHYFDPVNRPIQICDGRVMDAIYG